MKLTLDFQDNQVVITAEDDPVNCYRMVCRKDNMYSIWYNYNFVFEGYATTLADAVARFTSGIVQALVNNKLIDTESFNG